MRGIDLAFFEEDANTRTFTDPFLHETVRSQRDQYLSAIAAFFDKWVKEGRPHGNPFTSFPSWAEVVGGIMQASGLGDPCQPQGNFGANDRKTQSMRCLFQLAWDMHKDKQITKADIYQLIDPVPDPDGGYTLRIFQDEFNWFGPLREGDEISKSEVPKNQTRLGITLEAFNNRELCGIRLTIDKSSANSNRWRYPFQEINK